MTGAEGQRRAFEPFFRDHIDPVRRFVRTLVDASVVDDVVSQTFVTAWLRFDDLPSESPRAWLFGVARNHARNTWRSHRRAQALIEVIERGRRAHRDRELIDDVEIAPLLIALRELGEADRELLVLAGWFEMTPGEIGRVVGMRSGAVRVRLHRLRRRLDDRLVELGEGEEAV